MLFIFFTGGIIIGAIITKAIEQRVKIHGVIDVDHETEQCKFHITSSELSNPKSKIAVFMINHNAKISREEQGL